MRGVKGWWGQGDGGGLGVEGVEGGWVGVKG